MTDQAALHQQQLDTESRAREALQRDLEDYKLQWGEPEATDVLYETNTERLSRMRLESRGKLM